MAHSAGWGTLSCKSGPLTIGPWPHVPLRVTAWWSWCRTCRWTVCKLQRIWGEKGWRQTYQGPRECSWCSCFGYRWCQSYTQNLTKAGWHVCSRWHLSWRAVSQHNFTGCFLTPFCFVGFTAITVYTKLTSWLHSIATHPIHNIFQFVSHLLCVLLSDLWVRFL